MMVYAVLFSTLWLSFGCFGMFKAWTDISTDRSEAIGLILVLIPFTLSVPFFFYSGFAFERIVLNDGGVSWYDRYGRLKVSASLYDVESVDVVSGEASVARVYTRKGEIKFSSYIEGFADLVQEFRRITDEGTQT